MRPNLLCVVFDTARLDVLEPFGAPAGATPAVAQLAASGVTADPCATACWTLPSHASMFTGLLPRAAGLARVPGGRPQGAAEALARHRDRLLPEVLRRAGYETRAISANLWISEASGFATGFERFVSVGPGRQARLQEGDIRERAAWAVEGVRARVDDGAAEAARVLEGWLADGRRERPFFWFVNLIECHSPYLPPRPYNDLGPLERLRAAEDARRYLTFESILRACVGGLEVPDAALARMRHLYGRSVGYMDDWLARVLERLDAGRSLAETTVIVISDHGENLGEGGLISHALSLDDRLIRVPLIAAGPGAERAAGVRSLLELPRLVAEITGLDDHPWPDRLAADRHPVAQLEPPVPPGHPRGRESVERWGLGEEALRRLTTPFDCATDGRLKLIRREGRELVLDLATDPLELHPRPATTARPATAANPELDSLRASLDQAQAGAEAALDRPASASAPSQAASPEEVRDLEERMRLLGYL